MVFYLDTSRRATPRGPTSREQDSAPERDVAAAARALVRVVQARRRFDLGRDALLARRRGLRFACAEHELLAA